MLVRGGLSYSHSSNRRAKNFSRLTVDHLSLLVEPALRDVISPLENNMVALQAAGQIIPCSSDHGILALKILDNLVVGSLCCFHVSKYHGDAHHRRRNIIAN